MNFKAKSLLFLLIISTNIFGRSDDLLFITIEKHLSKFRYTIYEEDVSFNNGIVRVKINARRTNIKSQQLLGFYSVGRALQNSSSIFRKVQIIIQYEMKEGQKVLLTAPVDLVLKLSQGNINSEQFFNSIEN